MNAQVCCYTRTNGQKVSSSAAAHRKTSPSRRSDAAGISMRLFQLGIHPVPAVAQVCFAERRSDRRLFLRCVLPRMAVRPVGPLAQRLPCPIIPLRPSFHAGQTHSLLPCSFALPVLLRILYYPLTPPRFLCYPLHGKSLPFFVEWFVVNSFYHVRAFSPGEKRARRRTKGLFRAKAASGRRTPLRRRLGL